MQKLYPSLKKPIEYKKLPTVPKFSAENLKLIENAINLDTQLAHQILCGMEAVHKLAQFPTHGELKQKLTEAKDKRLRKMIKWVDLCGFRVRELPRNINDPGKILHFNEEGIYDILGYRQRHIKENPLRLMPEGMTIEAEIFLYNQLYTGKASKTIEHYVDVNGNKIILETTGKIEIDKMIFRTVHRFLDVIPLI